MYDMSYHPKPSHRDDKFTLVLIFAPCFVLLLSIAILGQLVGLHWQNWLQIGRAHV